MKPDRAMNSVKKILMDTDTRDANSFEIKWIFEQKRRECHAGVDKCVVVYKYLVVKVIPRRSYHTNEAFARLANAEYENYQDAVKRGIDSFVPETTTPIFFTTKNGQKVAMYAQARVSGDSPYDAGAGRHRDLIDVLPDEKRQYVTNTMLSNRISPEFIGFLLNKLPYTKCLSILRFLRVNRINDIHNSNWIVVDGMPMIFDFSGHYE